MSDQAKKIRLKNKAGQLQPASTSAPADAMTSNVRILQGTVFDCLPRIEPGSIDCAMTSPPYWMLRKYLPKGHPLEHLELGQEDTPALYVANVVRWCGLVRNCLADHGTLWLNIGSTYAGEGNVGTEKGQQGADRGSEAGATDANEPFVLRDDLTAEELAYVLSELAAHVRDGGEVR